jgi:hypothetical protein
MAAAVGAKTPAELFSQSIQDGHAETKLRCRMQNEDENDDGHVVPMRNGMSSSSASAAQSVTRSVAELARTVEQTEAQLRTQVRLNLVLVLLNVLTLLMVYMHSRAPVGHQHEEL